MRSRFKFFATTALASSCVLTGLAAAQETEPKAESPRVFSTVVVTAQKRAEDVQNVPLSIVALPAEVLEANNVDNVTGLTKVVPNFRVDSVAQSASAALRIRGFGTSSNAAIDPSVAPYIDGVFIPRPGAILTTFLDVENVEVLRGPQGTLFGRNATVGAISVHTHEPDTDGFEASIGAEAGNYGAYKFEGMVNMPVSDTFAIRIAGLTDHTDGYFENRLDGQTYGEADTTAMRASAKWDITPDLTWLLRADYAQTDGDGVNLSQVDTSSATQAQLDSFLSRLGGYLPVLTYPPSFTANQYFDNPDLDDEQYGFSSDLLWSVGNGFDLRLINAYRDWSDFQHDGDVVFTPADLVNRDSTFDSKSQSHELQLISPENFLFGDRFDFVAGLYYFEEDYDIGEVFNFGSEFCTLAIAGAAPGLVAPCQNGPADGATVGDFSQNSTSFAAYAQGNYDITDTIEVILGVRQTWDEKSGAFDQVVNNPAGVVLRANESSELGFDDSQFNWRFAINWDLTDDVMVFFNYATGYKSGGLNSAGGTAPLGDRRLFDSEESDNFELGIKSTLLSNRLQVNATAYSTTLDEFQQRSFDGTSFIIRNAGSLKAEGLELESQFYATDNLSFNLSAAMLEKTFEENSQAPGLPGCNASPTSCPTVQDLTGRTAEYSPKWTTHFGVQYETDPFMGGYTLTTRADMSYRSKYYSTGDLNPQSIIDEVTLYGANITLRSPDDSWSVALFGENITDEEYFTSSKFTQTLDSIFGVRNPATGASLLRGYLGAPATYGLRVKKRF